MDLQTLSRTTTDENAGAGHVPPPGRRWLTHAGLPLVLALLVLALIGYAARDLILPATPVHVVRATALASAVNAPPDTTNPAPAAGLVVAQAPGWVEPDPYPTYVTALASGIVKRVHVLEGQSVQAGQLLVELIDDDARLALARARAAHAKSRAALRAAQTELDESVALKRAKAVAAAQVAQAKAALARLDTEVAQQQARYAELQAAYKRLTTAGSDAVSALEIEAGKYRAESQLAVLEATRKPRPEMQAAIDAAEAELAAARRNLELKTELTRVRDEAAALVEMDAARVAEAELRLTRMVIESPIAGVVMLREVVPGSKLTVGTANQHSSDVIHLYDPSQLQVRVDVPLADAASVGVGQRAQVMVDVLPDVSFEGEVTRLVHLADIAKNTVQFKVAIRDPSPLLKPDMLARVKFYGTTNAGATAAAPSSTGGGAPVAIQRSAVVDGDGGPYVWWVSPTTQRLEQRPITLGGERGDGFVTVVAGLNPGDAVVDRPAPSLAPGQRVRIETKGDPRGTH